MTTAILTPRATPRLTWADRNPQWWVAVVAGVGWVVLVVLQIDAPVSPPPGASGHAGHLHHGAAPAQGPAFGPVALLAMHWLAMIAVMLPLSWANLRYAARRSPARARLRNTLWIGLGWLVPWVLGALALAALSLGLRPIGPLGAAAVGVGIGLVWLALPLRRRALARCHQRHAPPLRRPLPACRAFGMRLGRDCVVSCGPMMLVMAVTGHHLLAAVAMVALGRLERRRPHHDPGRVVPPVVLVATAVMSLALPGVVT